MAAAHRKNFNTGKLPALGLSKYKSDDLIENFENPFHVHPITEKMLVMKELEREVRQLNKGDKFSLKVYEKPIATR